jgi:serine/threonine protein phosphatase PrpC
MNPDANGFCQNCGLHTRLQRPSPNIVKFDEATDLGLVSDIGRHHPVNQDAGIVGRSPTGAVLMVVADGVSSSDKADLASATAVAAAYKVMEAATDDESADAVVRRAIDAANAAVKAIPRTNPHLEEPETTIVLALVRKNLATLAWVGDSRVYAVSSKHSAVHTRDDSWLADAVESGKMTLQEAQADNRAHSITQCLGMLDSDISIHVREITLEPDTWLLVCTDGLWNYYDHPTALASAVAQAAPDSDAFELCQHLVKLANLAGGYDNITVGAYHSSRCK